MRNQSIKRVFLASLLMLATILALSAPSAAQQTPPEIVPDPDQTLRAATPVENARFGDAIDIDGDTMVVGSGQEDFVGAVYVFTRTGDGWTQQQQLPAPRPATETLFGTSVAIDGDTLVAASDGATYVFTRTNETWTQQQRLANVGVITTDPNGFTDIRDSVGVEDDTIVATSSDIGPSGGVAVLTRTGTTWTRQQDLSAATANGRFGLSVAIDDGTIVTTESRGLGLRGDTLHVFVPSGNQWELQAELDAFEPDDRGIGVNVVTEFQAITESLAISGNTIVLGAALDDGPGTDHGAVYVFTRNGTSWDGPERITSSIPQDNGFFGISVDADDDTIVVGASSTDHQFGSGLVNAFTPSGTTWVPSTEFSVDQPESAGLGFSVAIDGDAVASGAVGDSTPSIAFAGAVHVFTFDDGVPRCNGLEITVDLAAGDLPTSGDDVILGTEGPDVINAGDGADVICGEGGDDVINAGNGPDIVFGGNGADTIQAGQGRDTVFGERGADFISGGKGKDTLDGGAGNDDIRGNEGTDTINGGAGNDELRGGQKADILNGNLGDDNLVGGTRPDILNGGIGLDTYNGGSGNDTCQADPNRLTEQTTNCEVLS